MASLLVDDILAIIREHKGDPPDFLEKHGAWVLTIVGAGTGLLGAMFAYFLKSRCRKIKCFGLECDRDVPREDAVLTATTPPPSNP
jgi:hypothetical protein